MNTSFRNCLLVFLLLFWPSELLPQDSTLTNLRRTDTTPLKNHSLTDKEKLFPLKPVSSATGIWTELNPKVPRVTYAGIHFVNKDTGWAVGDLGAIIKTTDGGSTWNVIETNTTSPILKVRSCNGQVVIASGYDGLILRSTDGGETFNQVPSGVGDGFDLWGLEMITDMIGWACGATALLKTTDSGENWQIVNTPGYTGNLWWIDFMTEDYGFIAADGKVLRTTDGGNNWEIIQAGDDAPLYCINIVDSLYIAAAGYGGTNYPGKNIYSSDGGYTWINGGFLTTEEVNDIKFINRDTGYVVMNTILAQKTTNRGQNWTPLAGIFDNYELQFLNNNIGYSAGTEVKINKTEGNLDAWTRLFINDNFSDVFFVSEQKGFAISSSTNSNFRGLYKTTNSGIDWQYVIGAPDGVDLLFLDSLTGFIGTDNIYKTTDGGETWYVPNGGSGGAGKIFFINEMTGWAIRSNKIYKTTDKGENWFTQFTAASSIGFTSIHFVDSLYGWTANSNGRPYKTTDGGENWIHQINLDIWQSLDVFFKDYLNGFLLESNKLYKTTNGGINFNLVPDITGFSIAGKLSHYLDSTIFITGYKTYRSIDAGTNWLDFIELTGTRINGLSLLGMGSGYAVGELGIVLKYYDETVPVELVSFEGRIGTNEITLSWITASELNNQGFDIERSCDRTNWETIGFINGKGTTTKINYYFFVDPKPLEGEINYRLKQVDYDGTFIFSKTVTIYFENTPLIFELLQNYPNPFNAVTRISFSIPVDSKVKLEIFDVLGKVVKTIINKDIIKGNYNIDFDASDLNSGVYFYRVMAVGINGKRYDLTKKMIVTK